MDLKSTTTVVTCSDGMQALLGAPFRHVFEPERQSHAGQMDLQLAWPDFDRLQMRMACEYNSQSRDPVETALAFQTEHHQ